MHENAGRSAALNKIDSALAALAGELQPIDFARRYTLFSQGETSDRLYIVISGKVKISYNAPDGREHLRGIVGPPGMVGELSMFDPSPRTASAITLTSVRAVSLDRDTLRAQMSERPELTEQLLRLLTRKLRRTTAKVTDQIFNDVPGRVASELLQLAQQFGTIEDGVVRLAHNLTQQEIAQLAGSSRETTNRALTAFAERGWIRPEVYSMLILDAENLARRAG